MKSKMRTISMKSYYIIMLISLVLVNCKGLNDCGECFTPPPQFILEIVDKESGENLYTNNTFSAEDLEIEGADNEEIKASFISENNLNLIDVSGIGWITGFHTYILTLSSDQSIEIDIDMAKKSDDCCTYFQVNKFDVRYFDFNHSYSTGFITIEI